ncbi:hypothetical protein C8R48DRAFT_676092 [Suillus tomentosus]|nr:hypothetical protein C8R48DRAFT_676092 [Suillus tomentosus]
MNVVDDLEHHMAITEQWQPDDLKYKKTIQDGLDNILQKHQLTLKKVPMNYNNYEKKIIEVYAVAIGGWTYENNICNPGKIGRRDTKSAQTVCDTDTKDEGRDNKQDNEQDNAGSESLGSV